MHRALIAIASLSLFACRGDRAAARKVPADAKADTIGPPSRIIEPPTVLPLPRVPTPRPLRDELVDAGRGPRRTLRYHLEPTARSVVATARITSHAYDGGWADPVVLAPVGEGFEVTPTAGGPMVPVAVAASAGTLRAAGRSPRQASSDRLATASNARCTRGT